MAYDQRKEDLRKRLVKAEMEDKSISAVEANALRLGWLEWLDIRKRLLDDLLALVTDASPDKREQEKEWQSKLDSVDRDANRTLMDVLGSVSPPASEKAKALAQTTLIEESGFLNGLAGLAVAKKRDGLVAFPALFAQSTADLEKKWTEIYEGSRSLNDREREVTDVLKGLLRDELDLASQRYRSSKESAADFGIKAADQVGSAIKTAGAAALVKAGGIAGALAGPAGAIVGAGVGAALQTVLDKGAKMVEKNDTARERLLDYKQLMKRQSGGVFIGYKQARDTVNDFLKNNGYDQVKNHVSEATSACDAWIGAMPGDASGMRSDAAEFKGPVISKLKDYLAAADSAYLKFVDNNKEKFLGPIGPSVTESLAQMTQFDEFSGQITAQATNLQDLIRQFNTDNDQWWVIDIRSDFAAWLGEGWSALSQSVRDQMESELKAQLDEIKKRISERVKQVITDNRLVTDAVSGEQIKSGLDRVKDLVEPLQSLAG